MRPAERDKGKGRERLERLERLAVEAHVAPPESTGPRVFPDEFEVEKKVLEKTRITPVLSISEFIGAESE